MKKASVANQELLEENSLLKQRVKELEQAESNHRQMEEALRESERKLSEAQSLAQLGHWIWDVRTGDVEWSEEVYRIFQLDPKSFVPQIDSIMALSPWPEDHQRNTELIRKAMESNEKGSYEQRFLRPDKSIGYYVSSFQGKYDDKGTLVSIVGTVQDITERKQVEEALRQTQRLLNDSQEISKVGGWEYDLEKKQMTLTDKAYQIYGLERNDDLNIVEVIGSYDEGDRRIVEQAFTDAVNEGKPYDLELKRRAADGAEKWVHTIGRPVQKDGKVIKVTGNIMDITDRKRAEDEKTILESQLFRAQKMEALGTLTGGIVHDFNNILTALVGYTALLKMKIHDNTLLTFVDEILSASRKATDLIQSLLAFSRQQAISLRPISIHGIIKGTGKLLKRLVTEDITIKTVLNTEDIAILADASQIDQILFNLATNARDAMPQGGTLTIEAETMEMGEEFRRFHGYGEPGRYVLLRVSDTGMGMDRATRDRIFDPFFTTKEAGKGTGLGLSTVYGIVKQHNGYITVYSEPGIGTTFHIYLPAVSEVGHEEGHVSVPVKGGNEIILVAEDSEAVRSLICRILNEYGYTTIEAIDGADATEQFIKADTVDLLILDSVMPKMNGRQAYHEIRKIKPDTRVIFTSGYTKDVFLDKGIEDGEFNFLQKPISPRALLQKVREMLDNEESD